MSTLRLISILCLTVLGRVKCQCNDYFLPKNVKPLRYIITIIPQNLTTYTGNVEIELEAIENTSNITIHSKDIQIEPNNVKIFDRNSVEVNWNNTVREEKKDFYIINLNKDLIKGSTYNLSIQEFIGSLTETRTGFFSAIYEESNKSQRYFAATEFEPTFSRRAFPCFDEPNLKAKFIIKIVRPSWMVSASNMPLQETIDLGNDNYLDVFKETPLMSTYLVAFIVSNFKYTKQNGKIRILVEQGHLNDGSTDFVLEESVKVLQALEEYTGIQYPLDKLDLVAIPEAYYIDGAMENWGLITYSDRYLICPNDCSYDKIQKCLTFTAHEFAHQWFGNLATPKSWHYVWLSEGFASYFQYYIAHIVKPSWRIMEQYFLEEYRESLAVDYIILTEPVDFEFQNEDAFPDSSIYYKKASAIIRMVEHVLTDEIHRNGLRIYLQNNKFKNTEPVNLYNAYEEAVKNANATHLLGNFTVHEMMSTWTKNPAYPLITVTRHYDTGKVTFSQKRFKLEKNDENNVWYIPTTYTLENNADFETTTTDIWLTNENVTVDLGTSDGWILVNKKAIGYYRVCYDETNWARITNFLKSKDYNKIPPLNRAQLLFDAYNLALYKYISYDIFFNLTMYLQQEIDYIPIKTFLDIFEGGDVIKVNQSRNIVNIYVTKLLNGINAQLKLNKKENDSHVDRLNRNLVQRIMCKTHHDDCVNEAVQKFMVWRTSGVLDVDPYVKKHWLCSAIKKVPASSWNFLLERYFSANDNSTKTTYMYALSCTENSSLLNRLLKEVFNLDNAMSPEDRSFGLSSILLSSLGMDLFIAHIQTMTFETRYCNSFVETEGMFVPAELSQLTKMKPILNKMKTCIPLSFYVSDDSTLLTELITWLDKYIQD